MVQSGRPWLIARPSIVVGAQTDGRIRRFDSLYRVFKLLAEGRLKMLPAATGASLNFVPIDHVAQALSALALRHQNFVGSYVHISSKRSMSVSAFISSFGAFRGLTMPRLVAPQDFDTANLPKSAKKLFDRILKPYLPYFQQNPKFATGNLERLTGLPSPSLDQNALHRLIAYSIEAGFVSLPPAEATPEIFSQAP